MGEQALVSFDWGSNWQLVRDYVFEAQWGPESETIYAISVPAEEQSGAQFGGNHTSRQFFQLLLAGEVKYESPRGVTHFKYSDGVLYLAREGVDKSLTMEVSSTGTPSGLLPAKFSASLGEFPNSIESYTVLDSSEGVSYIHVNRPNTPQKYGTVYSAPIAGTDANQYSVSLRNNRLVSGQVDFQAIGVAGIYFANTYDVSLLGDATEQKVVTQVTHNKGSLWQTLPVPADSTCSSPVGSSFLFT